VSPFYLSEDSYDVVVVSCMMMVTCEAPDLTRLHPYLHSANPPAADDCRGHFSFARGARHAQHACVVGLSPVACFASSRARR